MREIVDLIQCPYCNHNHTYDDWLDVGDMAGEFEMECEECGQLFNVDFYSIFHFTTTQK